MSVKPRTTLRKDPDAILVYEFDWSDWLGSAEIVTSTWAIEGADSVLTKDQASVVSGNQRTRVRLTAGTLGVTYTVVNRVVTNEVPAQTDDRSVYIQIKEQ